ncbi:Tyrosine-protein kinase styk1 [Saguinus oedipus]|uniref:Tyrosine-protein kinase styk1 n=1 Tax=Saguinus oedipus TaxID=9490 RepID=A0ABQ9UW97_SAGOE|nr:Tyrosine-protein kinase styk1 [Saguinus oedipus]
MVERGYRIAQGEEDIPVAMGDERGMTRMLLECSLSDKLCVIQEKQYEVIIVPTFLVTIFLILLGVILWLFMREQRTQQQHPGPREKCQKTAPRWPERKLLKELPCQFVSGSAFRESPGQGKTDIAPVPPSRDLSWEAAGCGGNVALPLKETSVENFLGSTTPALAKLEVPREQLSEVLEQICNGSCGPIFRASMNTGDPSKPKSVILKALKEPAGLHEVQDFLGRVQFHQYLGKHKNLVQLEGCCTEKLPLYMVLEDVAHGDLLSFLWTCRRDVMTMNDLPYDLTEKQVYHIGEQVLLALFGNLKHSAEMCDSFACFGSDMPLLEFLQDKHLFHGDVAARNILIQSDLTAKLCGLGLAYEVYTRGAISSQTIPLKWLAPERLLLRPAGIKADVYSIMKSCWHWHEAGRPSPRELRLCLEAAVRTADDKAVLQVPELVVPELYAAVAGIRVESLFYNYSIL